MSLNGRHRGETIYVLGAGPQLGSLSSEERRWLSTQITIGVNRTQYALKPTYFLSAYPVEVMLASDVSPESEAIHMKLGYTAPLDPKCITVRRRAYGPRSHLSRRFTWPYPTLLTQRNVALGATHLAMVLGADRVVYIGVEQRNKLHFYDLDEGLRQRMRVDLADLADSIPSDPDHPTYSLARVVEALHADPDELADSPFYDHDHAPTFARLFRDLRRFGIEPVATTRNSVVADAGASMASLPELRFGTGT